MPPVVSNARLGMVIFLAAEVMFFSGLIGAYIVFRVATPLWPPAGLPKLPLGITGVNTVILVASGFTMRRGLVAIRTGSVGALGRWLGWTALLGTVFLVVQGAEWTRLIGHGLTLREGTYGAIFYTLIGFHAIHVLGAVLWLLAVLLGIKQNRYSAERHTTVVLCGMYWYFVCALWVVLFGLVYP